jgi:STE24 endopeptidase
MADLFTAAFLLALATSLALRFGLAWRQMRAVARHAGAVPAQFAATITLEAHRKAAAYTIARQRLGLVDTAVGAMALVALTLLGGLQAVDDLTAGWLGTGLVQQTAVVVAVVSMLALLDLPFAWYRQFRLEQAFGFNRSTPALFVTDLLKSVAVGAAIGLPLLVAVLWLMQRAGTLWWLWAWLLWSVVQLVLTLLAPVLIAPLFNRFTPLPAGALRERVQALLARTGFSSRGVFTMDGSRRSSHGNAYFTGFGRARRIVFFDTLLERLAPEELEAVLAHELGHFKLHHIRIRLALGLLASFGLFALLGGLAAQPWFYQGLGVTPASATSMHGIALVLFVLVLPLFTFPLAPLASLLSRRHEFEADAFAARESSAAHLVTALVKLYNDNASTLTPDPLHSAFYDSHPPAAIRIGRLQSLGERATLPLRAAAAG